MYDCDAQQVWCMHSGVTTISQRFTKTRVPSCHGPQVFQRKTFMYFCLGSSICSTHQSDKISERKQNGTFFPEMRQILHGNLRSSKTPTNQLREGMGNKCMERGGTGP